VLALAATGFVKLLPARAATLSREEVFVDGINLKTNPRDGTLSLENVKLRQGKDTFVSAQSATLLEQENARWLWDLKGSVHVEFRSAVLDSDSARLLFTERELATVNVKGSPARFSHRPANNPGRQNLGRANAIDYDAASSKVKMSGDSWYSNGQNIEVSSKTTVYVYDLKDGSLASTTGGTGDGRTQLILRQDKRVPTPRTPDRSTSQ
jgi:lipopolysaccharide export system protein LptA